MALRQPLEEPDHPAATATASSPPPRPMAALLKQWRTVVYELIEDEEARRPGARAVQASLIAMILVSVAVAVIDTVPDLQPVVYRLLRWLEHLVVLAFTLEYLLRLWSVVEDRAGHFERAIRGRLRYMLTPMALVDLLAILPSWLSLVLPIDPLLLRALRLLRVLKVARFSPALSTLQVVLYNERRTLLSTGIVLGIVLLMA